MLLKQVKAYAVKGLECRFLMASVCNVLLKGQRVYWYRLDLVVCLCCLLLFETSEGYGFLFVQVDGFKAALFLFDSL